MTDVAPLTSDYFDHAYRDYRRQNPAYKLDHYLNAILSARGEGPLSVLDIGCGLGSFLELVAARRSEWRLAATDTDPLAVATTTTRVPTASVVQASAEEQPFPEDSFDVITAWDVIEHVPDLQRVGAAVQRMLRPDGVFLFVVPVYDGPLGWLVRRLDKDPTHLHRRPRRFWLEWANDHCRVDSWHGVFRYLLGSWYLHLPTRGARSWAPAILVACSQGNVHQ